MVWRWRRVRSDWGMSSNALRPIAIHRLIHRHIAVQIQVILRWADRRVGADEREIPECRAGGVASLNGATHLAGCPVRGMALFGQMPRPT